MSIQNRTAIVFKSVLLGRFSPCTTLIFMYSCPDVRFSHETYHSFHIRNENKLFSFRERQISKSRVQFIKYHTISRDGVFCLFYFCYLISNTHAHQNGLHIQLNYLELHFINQIKFYWFFLMKFNRKKNLFAWNRLFKMRTIQWRYHKLSYIWM